MTNQNLETPLPGIPPEENPAGKVLEKTVEILNATTNGSDQELDEAVTQLHPRAARKLAEWLEFDGQQTKISPEEMPRAASRLRNAAPRRTRTHPPAP